MVGPDGPATNLMLPKPSTVLGWQSAQSRSVKVARWEGVAGGTPWQVPHAASPVRVHTGRAAR